MTPSQKSWTAAAAILMVTSLAVWLVTLASARTKVDTIVASAICSVVYPLDESSGNRGIHYTFYGNAFFINEEGYLLTAAHVLSDFRDGGEPHILLRRKEAPPRAVKVETVAIDVQHDIAILRAVPNPFETYGKSFEGKYAVAFLPLTKEKPAPGTAVFAAALRPSRLKDPHSFDAPREERSPAGILRYTTTKLEKGQPESELFLFDHEVERGQSGAPILSQGTGAVLGIVEGQWLRGISVRNIQPGNQTSNIGAAIPIAYALQLLEAKQIAWHETGSTRNGQPVR